MKATVMDMRRNPKKILDAIARNEKVTLSMRGREIAEIVPLKKEAQSGSAGDHPAIGIWSDRANMADPSAYVRNLRKSRVDVV